MPSWPITRNPSLDPLHFLSSLAASGSDAVPFLLGKRQAFLINHPDLVEQVLAAHEDSLVKGPGYERASSLLGRGLLTGSGAEYDARRRPIGRAFLPSRLAELAPSIVRVAARRLDGWREHAPIDIQQEMRALTLSVSGECLFGMDLSPRLQGMLESFALASSRLDALCSPVSRLDKPRHARRRLEPIVDAILGGAADAGDGSLLSTLIQLRDGGATSDALLRDDIVTFLVASHETLSIALTWVWQLLAVHPEHDARLQQEIDAVLSGRDPGFDDLPRLPYARAVLAEALRLYPPAWVIVRVAVRPLAIGDAAVPAGAFLVASPYVAHRDPRFHERPNDFTPERWLDTGRGSCPRPRKGSFIPFGSGPRSCIGEQLAWLEGTLLVATVARRWRLIRTDGAPLRPSTRFSIRPGGEPAMLPTARPG